MEYSATYARFLPLEPKEYIYIIYKDVMKHMRFIFMHFSDV